jgi:hypothetical protein
MSIDKNCKTCNWYRGHDEGVCMSKPPIVNITTTGIEVSSRPIVYKDDFCNEHSRRKHEKR